MYYHSKKKLLLLKYTWLYGKLVLGKIVSREKEFSSVVTKFDVRHWLEGNALDAGSRGTMNKRTKDALKGEEEDSRRELRLIPFPWWLAERDLRSSVLALR